jgi:tetratricopeptide (TPR) repeat protein
MLKKGIPFLFIALISVPLYGQNQVNTDFQMANRLMQQQRFEDASVILKRIYESNPTAYIFYERYTECLINLKDFDTAIEISERSINQGIAEVQTAIRLGEIYHIQGNREKAFETWEDVISNHSDNLQTYYNLGSALTSRREFDRSVELYKDARTRFESETLFINELSNAYMQAGKFPEAMNEYVALIKSSPNQMSFVQQRIFSMRDRNLYGIAALEVEDALLDLDSSHQAYGSMHQLLTWLLMETEQYRRALVSARQYESRTPTLNYALYSLANQLASARQYELSIEAYNYYTEINAPSVTYRAMHQKADVYRFWADWLKEYNIESFTKRKELFDLSRETYSKLAEISPRYERIHEVYMSLAELELDVFHDPEQAEKWIEKLETLNSENTVTLLNYAIGRIELYAGNYALARQQFTRANRDAEDSELAEKIRFFLALTDFYAGDFEFATLQLRSLERRPVSFYANNALQLRLWIQEGSRIDSTGALLKGFSEVVKTINHGETAKALDMSQLILADSFNPFRDDLLIYLNQNTQPGIISDLYTINSRLIAESATSPLRERLIWEQVKMAMVLHEKPVNPDGSGLIQISKTDIEYYLEQIIMEFPDGFYAPFARQILQEYVEQSS